MDGGNRNGIAEGSHLSVRFVNNESLVKINASGKEDLYWTRTPDTEIDFSGWPGSTNEVFYVGEYGENSTISVSNGYIRYCSNYSSSLITLFSMVK